MSPIRRYYLRLFASTAIPFGVAMVLMNGVFWIGDDGYPGIGGAVVSSLLAAVFFGLVMTLYLGRKHVRAVEKLVGAATAADLDARQSRVVETGLAPEEAFDRCLEAIHGIPKATVVARDPDTGTIEAKVGTTWQSWGEIITVAIVPTSDAERATESRVTGSRVTITSRPSFARTVADYGTNLGHVLRIEKHLTGDA